MASTRQIKSRIRSVSSNKQITKAMELVASSKLRRAQDSAMKTRRYTEEATSVLAALSRSTDVRRSPLFTVRTVKHRILIVITSDRGLAGAYNANALKLLTQQLRQDNESHIKTTVITVGRKAAQFVAKLRDVETVGSYQVSEAVRPEEIRPILVSVAGQFRSGAVDTVDVITTRFINSFTQTAKQINLLPAGADIDNDTATTDMTFEPSASEVLDYVATRLIEAYLFQAILDARASEHAMRRVAMKNASDNAGDIVDALTLEMNKVRQASITQELSEISAGVEAMN